MRRSSHLVGTLGWGAMALASACGDVYADPDSDVPEPSGVVTMMDAGVSAVSPTIRPALICPAGRPRENSSCAAPGSTCEYGESADRQCNAVLACTGVMVTTMAWTPRPNEACFSNICPVTTDITALDGKPCALDADGGPVTDNDEAVCNMTDGICACTTGRDGATKHERRWVCVRPESVCPTNRPHLGASCNGSLWCDYGSCAFKRGLLMECSNDVWVAGGASCE